MTKPGYETISGAEPGRIDRERKGKDDETAELHKPDGRWRKLAADKPALMLCHTGAEDARTESGAQNAQDMDHAVASVPRALRIREDVGRVTQIGRAHVWTPGTNTQLVARLLLEKKKRQ